MSQPALAPAPAAPPSLPSHAAAAAIANPAAPEASPGLVDRLRARLGIGAAPAAAVAPPIDPLAALTDEREQLAARLSATVDQLETTRASLTTLQTAHTQATADLSAAQATLAAIEALVPGITTAAAPDAALAAATSRAAAGIVATMGLPEGTAPAAAPAGTEPSQNTLTLADFNDLPIGQRNNFMRNGGKLKD